MEIDDNTRYEIKAEAFRAMTGFMAPGKDAREGPSYEERAAAWDVWSNAYSGVVNATIAAAARVIE